MPNSYRSDLLEYYICNGSNDLEGKPFKNIVKKGKMNSMWPGGREF